MTPVVFILTTVGVGYTSWLLMRFIVWLDGGDRRPAADPERTTAHR